MSGKNKNCPICGQTFVELRSMHLHCVQNHPKKFICCPICYLLFKAHDYFVKHSNLHHERLMKRIIGIKGDDFKSFAKYDFDVQMTSESRCMACLKCFSSTANARLHYKESHLMFKYLCHCCPQSYASLQHLRWHYRSNHESKSNDESSRDEPSRKFAGFTISNVNQAKAIYMKRIGLQGNGVFRRLQLSTNNKIGTNSSTAVNRWTIENDLSPWSRTSTQKLTYRNK